MTEETGRTFRGLAVSDGYAVAEALIYVPWEIEVAQITLDPQQTVQALENWKQAREKASRELDAMIARMNERGDQEQAKIFRAHQDILFDEEIEEMITQEICSENKSPDWATAWVFQTTAEILENAGDDLIAARTADLRDVCSRLLRNLHGVPEKNLMNLERKAVIVAHDLLPSDTAALDREQVMGIVTETGSATSHTAIIARSYRIPAVLGVKDATRQIGDGDLVALDAQAGMVICRPNAQQVEETTKKASEFREFVQESEKYRRLPALTLDNVQIEIGLNIGSTEKDENIPNVDFVGLCRTEFLYMQRASFPTEEEQFAAYREILLHAQGKPVTLRTLDIGGDKTLPYLELPKEENPFLGERALRLCFRHPDLFLTQLRAALRASVFGNLWIMFPMVGSLEDIRRAKKLLADAKEELRAKGIPFDEHVKAGIMIEIPSIAAVAEQAAAEVDFASVGTNDLCQYLFAADRMNPAVAEYGEPLSPAMLRVLYAVAKAFNEAGKPISVCGELASDPDAAVALAGIGYRKLSMSGSCVAAVKRRLCGISLQKTQRSMNEAMKLSTQQEVRTVLKNL